MIDLPILTTPTGKNDFPILIVRRTWPQRLIVRTSDKPQWNLVFFFFLVKCIAYIPEYSVAIRWGHLLLFSFKKILWNWREIHTSSKLADWTIDDRNLYYMKSNGAWNEAQTKKYSNKRRWSSVKRCIQSTHRGIADSSAWLLIFVDLFCG